MRRFRLWPLLAACLLLPCAVRAQTDAFTPAQRAEIVRILRDALRTDPSILRDAVTALQADEANAQNRAAQDAIAKAGPALFDTASDPVAGNPRGSVTLIEFYDLHCPYCRRMAPIMQSLVAARPDLRIIYKDIPILGPGSMLGARAVLAAQQQGGYARLQQAIMEGPSQITEESIREAATQAGLDWTRLHRDMGDPRIQARIDVNLALAQSLGIQGTPAYVVGHTMLAGAMPLADLQAAIDRAHG